MSQRDRPGAGATAPISASSPSSSQQPSSASAECSEGGEGSQLRPLVQVTPEMTNAGMSILSEWANGENESPFDFVSRIYLAMHLVAPRASEQDRTKTNGNGALP